MTPTIEERTTEERAAGRPITATVEQTLGKIFDAARVSAVYGQPVERGETTIIPCSEIVVGMGMGGGMGTAPAEKTGETSGGEGIGGGGGARGRPVAIVVVTKEGVRIEPVVDVTKVALAGATTAAFVFLWLVRMAGVARGGGRGRAPSIGRLAKALKD